MARLKVGDILPDFRYETPFERGLLMSSTACKANRTALVFLRYYGCTLCQYDMHEIADNYQHILGGGAQLLVVLQSEPKKLVRQLAPDAFPFSIVCDPQQELYHRFEIMPARSKESMLDSATLRKIEKARQLFSHGEYEGEELQLPAVFVFDGRLSISYVHYGKTAGDIPGTDELIALLT